MGVGIFAARKISLLNSINNLEMMMTQLSSRQMTLSTESMNIAMQQNNLQSSMLQMGGQQQQSNNIWGSVAGLAGGVGNLAGGSQYGQQVGQVASSAVSCVGSIVQLCQNKDGNNGETAIIAAKQQQIELDNKLLQLQQQEKRLEMTMKTLETQLNMKNQELTSVEKAEEKAIQRSAPKYGEA